MFLAGLRPLTETTAEIRNSSILTQKENPKFISNPKQILNVRRLMLNAQLRTSPSQSAPKQETVPVCAKTSENVTNASDFTHLS